MVTIIPVGAFSDNYVWMLCEGRHAVAVDPGDAAPVLAFLDREGLELTAILATHHHGDHVGGIPALVERFAVPVFGPAREAIPARTRALGQGDRIEVTSPAFALHVIDIPGHTSGHIAYAGAIDDAPVVFCGDTLFAAGCGRIFEGTPGEMWESLGKLAALPAATRVYCGHEYTLANLRFALAVEPGSRAIAERIERESGKRKHGQPTLPSTLGDELATNPFLRVREPRVRDSAERAAGHALDDDVAVFAALRAWKNRFA